MMTNFTRFWRSLSAEEKAELCQSAGTNYQSVNRAAAHQQAIKLIWCPAIVAKARELGSDLDIDQLYQHELVTANGDRDE